MAVKTLPSRWVFVGACGGEDMHSIPSSPGVRGMVLNVVRILRRADAVCEFSSIVLVGCTTT